MITAKTGWALIGDQPELAHTTDGGAVWTSVTPSSAPGGPLFYALNAQTAWLALLQSASQPTVVYATNDAGGAWQHGPAFETHVAAGGGGSLYFLNAQVGWLEEPTQGNPPQGPVGGPVPGPGTPAPLYATTDGGLHWQLVTGSLPSAGGLVFTSAATGFLASRDTAHPLYATTNGGVAWAPVTSFPTGVDVVNGPVFSGASALAWVLQMPPDGIPLGVEPPVYLLVASADGGHAWTSHPTSFSIAAPGDVQILNAATAVAITTNGAVQITSDGGETWTRHGPSPALARVLSHGTPQQVDFISPSVGWLQVQLERSLTSVWYSTANGGATWTPVAP